MAHLLSSEDIKSCKGYKVAHNITTRGPAISILVIHLRVHADIGTGVSPYGFVTVLGEIVNPGPVNMPPTMDLTVTKALQMAGNTKPFANKRNVLVTRRAKDGSLIRTEVDIIEIGEKGRIDKDIILKPGDVVFVRESVL